MSQGTMQDEVLKTCIIINPVIPMCQCHHFCLVCQYLLSHCQFSFFFFYAERVSRGFIGTLIPYKCYLSVEDDIIHQNQCKGLCYGSHLHILQVHVIGLSVCTRETYQSMKERKVDDGHIININGMCGHRVLHNADVHFYNATKYAVTALIEGLRQELREAKTHIRATVRSVSLVETELTYRLLSQNPKKAACLQAAEIANAVVYVLSAPPHVQANEWDVLMIRICQKLE
uniref:Dehydrogenase/reductase SDR family member 11 n=1 Tax=Cyprinus carpio TaxID=7962 RepID=A0A8C2JD83_CYPCA